MSFKCRDEAHRPDFYGSWERKWWCPQAESMRFFKGPGAAYPDGRSINWLRFCKKTGKVVVHNKWCDAEDFVVPPIRRKEK